MPAATTAAVYTFTADEPLTATNFQLDIGTYNITQGVPYALVHVPDGYQANVLNYPTVAPQNLYEPVQNVLISGVITNNSQGIQDHRRSRYSRKLREGDRIALLVYNPLTEAVPVSFELNFTTVH